MYDGGMTAYQMGSQQTSAPDPRPFEAGDQVEILVGGPHENQGRIATVAGEYRNGDLGLRFSGDREEWIYSPHEVRRLGGDGHEWKAPHMMSQSERSEAAAFFEGRAE